MSRKPNRWWSLLRRRLAQWRCTLRHYHVARPGRRRSPASREALGRAGERAAARYLRRHGYRIVARRHRRLRGEIDLVAVAPDRTLVFVEVKTRRGDDNVAPGAAVTPQKQRRIVTAALGFVAEHGLEGVPIRFDVVAVAWPLGRRRPVIRHESAAFSPPDPISGIRW